MMMFLGEKMYLQVRFAYFGGYLRKRDVNIILGVNRRDRMKSIT